jgi:hypothetical protein
LVGKKSPRRRAVNRGRDDGWLRPSGFGEVNVPGSPLQVRGDGLARSLHRQLPGCRTPKARQLAKEQSSFATVCVEPFKRCCEDICSRHRGCEDGARLSAWEPTRRRSRRHSPVAGCTVLMQTACRLYAKKVSEPRHAVESDAGLWS